MYTVHHAYELWPDELPHKSSGSPLASPVTPASLSIGALDLMNAALKLSLGRSI